MKLDLSKFDGHTPGPFWFREYMGTDEDLAQMRKFGMEPVPALSNEGARFLMSGPEEDAKRVGLVDAQLQYKRGKGHQLIDDKERDANARLFAAAPQLLAELREARAEIERLRGKA